MRTLASGPSVCRGGARSLMSAGMAGAIGVIGADAWKSSAACETKSFQPPVSVARSSSGFLGTAGAHGSLTGCNATAAGRSGATAGNGRSGFRVACSLSDSIQRGRRISVRGGADCSGSAAFAKQLSPTHPAMQRSADKKIGTERRSMATMVSPLKLGRLDRKRPTSRTLAESAGK